MEWDGVGWSGTAQSRRLNQGILHAPRQPVTRHLLSLSSGGTGNSSKLLWMPGEITTLSSLGPLETERNPPNGSLGREAKNQGCESRVISVPKCQKREKLTVHCAGAAEPETDKAIFFFLRNTLVRKFGCFCFI